MNDISTSIIIPCYNHGIYLIEALDSIKKYNSNDIEVIIVNDGSSDNKTLEIFKKLANEGYCILHQKNMGLGAARNAGIKIAKGKYILPLDSDNKILPEYITKGTEILEKNKDVAVVYGKPKYFGDHQRIWPIYDFDLEKLIISNYIDACALIRKSAFEDVGGYDEHMPVQGYEDWDLWLRMAFSGYKFQFIDEYLYEYRVRKDSMIEDSIKDNHKVIDYLFNKDELRLAKSYRELFSKNQQLENSIRLLSKNLIKNIKMRIKSYFH